MRTVFFFLCLLFWFCLALLIFPGGLGAGVPLEKLTKSEQRQRIKEDLKMVLIYREGLRSVLRFAATDTNLFPTTSLNEARILKREDKERVWNMWKAFLEYMMGLETIAARNQQFYLLSGENRNDAFLARYSAFLAQYRFALAVIERLDHDPGFTTLLNDPVPEIGIPANTFAQLKFRFLHVNAAAQYAALGVVNKTMSDDRAPLVGRRIQEDENAIWAATAKGEALTIKNALEVVRQTGSSTWLPVQTGIAEWMGHTKVWRKNQCLISAQQIRAMIPRLEPGDVMIIRHEWYLSNVGLPGYWPHAALYIGTSSERRKYFAGPEMEAWLKQHGGASGDFERWLRERNASAYAESLTTQHGNPRRVIEAISEGVSLTPLEHAADADSLVVLRPRLSKQEKAQAIARAFHYVGRPYDFEFDFATDAALVCSELVYKAYEPGTQIKGLTFPLTEVLGRKTLPPNEIVHQFDNDYGTAAQQFDMVLFLDGIERSSKAVESDLAAFRSSWKRPKWHVLVQEARN